MEKVRPWCGRPSDRGRLKNRTLVCTAAAAAAAAVVVVVDILLTTIEKKTIIAN